MSLLEPSERTRSRSAVDCRVRIADPQTPGSFDLELRLGDRMMPRFELRGRVVSGEVATLALAVSLTEGQSFPELLVPDIEL